MVSTNYRAKIGGGDSNPICEQVHQIFGSCLCKFGFSTYYRKTPSCCKRSAIRFCRRFSHPVALLNQSFLTVNNGIGKIEGISASGPSGQLCGTYQVSDNLFKNSTRALATPRYWLSLFSGIHYR